ncbi:hypothetical protein EDB89DRAFT_2080374 [Lactarius sanguifluus]|nr:hypothetical protein EDB89DRAFT_2080374 [Lactarius sanguifluus]
MSLERSIAQQSAVYKLACYNGQSLRLSTCLNPLVYTLRLPLPPLRAQCPFSYLTAVQVLSATIPCKPASAVVEPSVLITVVLCPTPSSPPPPVFRFPRRASLSSDMSDYDYDFSEFGHWDGDSASYYEEYDHYNPSVLPHLRPKPLTPLASPPTSVQELEQDPPSTDTQDKNASTNEPPSRPPSPTTCPTTPRPATPLEYEGEAFPPLLHTQTQEEFDTHRNRQLHRHYPSTSYYDISESSRIDSWVDPPLVLKSLVNLFEFGETWDTYAFNDFQDDLSAVVDACNDQLLFWHLSDRTPEQLILWTKSDYLWFNHIPPRRNYLIQQLQAGNSVRYLDRFRLSYEEIEITFCEIRVVDREGPPSLVITEGTELTYSWERTTWETTLNNPDHNLVNPRIYHKPPTDPNDPELVELLTARRTNPLSLLARLSLPASSLETEETNNSSNNGWGEEPNECKFKRGILIEDDSNKDASSTHSEQFQEILIEGDNVKVNTSSFQSEQPRGKLTKAERDRRFQEQLCLYCGNPGHILRECKLKTQSMRARDGHPSHNKDGVQGTFVEETLDQENTPENLPAQIGAFHFEDCKRLAINLASAGRSNNEEVRDTVVEERDQEDDPADFWTLSEVRYRKILPYSPDAGPQAL